jgi:hypothetical protein
MNMTPSVYEGAPKSVDALDLSSVLNEPDVREHFRQMYRIGSVALHESGFAVYNNRGNPHVSSLLLPVITDQDLSSDRAWNQHTVIDLTPLVRNSKYTEVFLGDKNTYDERELGEFSKQRIVGIINSDEYDFFEKQDIIERIITVERDKKSTVPKYRDNIALLCHNHPQQPAITTHPNNLLYPSVTDLRAYDNVRSSNANLVEGIVASDGDVHKLILFKAQSDVITHPDRYDAAEEVDNKNCIKRLGSLAMSGYSYVVLGLTQSGEVDDISKKDLDQFASKTTVT